jgi:LPS export ABC transporter protein LptC
MIKAFFHKKIFQAAIYCSCLFVLGCENDERDIDAWTGKKIMIEEAIQVNTLFSQSGNLKANLKSPLMLRYLGDTVYVEFPKTLHVDFYDSLGKRESWLDAKYGKYMESLNKVFLKDSVRVININGDTLRTSELWWDQTAKIFYTDSVISIITKDKRIRGGKGLVAAQDLNSYTIKQPTGTVLVSNSILAQ